MSVPLAALAGQPIRLSAIVVGLDPPTVTWSSTAGEVSQDGLLTAPEAAGPITVTATSVADPSRSGSAAFQVFVPDLPVLVIDTDRHASIESKETYVSGTLLITTGYGAAPSFGPAGMQIRGRGNSTWGLPKKPYKLKLGRKAGLLGMPADKEWALLANYWDRSLIRNSVAMELARRLSEPGRVAWSPRSEPVHLVLNGLYDGVYQLIETVKAAPARVDIVELEAGDTAGEALTGGYLLEFDRWWCTDADVCFDTSRGQRIAVKEPGWDPGEVVPEQLAYVQAYVQEAEDALFGDAFADPETGYAKYWDVSSLVDWYLVEELMKNTDADLATSCFFSKDRGGKLRMGPVWDFDLSAGNNSSLGWAGVTGWRVRQGSYLTRLFEDPAFVAQVRGRWDAVKATHVDTVFALVDELAAELDRAQAANFQRWQVLGIHGKYDPAPWPATHQGEVDDLKAWLEARIAWIDANL